MRGYYMARFGSHHTDTSATAIFVLANDYASACLIGADIAKHNLHPEDKKAYSRGVGSNVPISFKEVPKGCYYLESLMVGIKQK